MLVRDVNLQGGYITITSPGDALALNRYEAVAFQFACPVFFVNCQFINAVGVTDVTAINESQNHALRINDPGPVNDAEYCFVMGATFDRCYFPVVIEGRNCEILYSEAYEQQALNRVQRRLLKSRSRKKNRPRKSPWFKYGKSAECR